MSDDSPATSGSPPVPPTIPAKERSIAQFAEAFAKAQGEFEQPVKNRTSEVKKEGRLLYTTKFADLTAVIESFRPHLSKHGLSFTQKTRETPRGWRLVLTVLHSSGEYDETSMPIILDQAPQQVGSQLTYLKRYQAAAYFGIAADEDDDANGAEGKEAEFKDKEAKKGKAPGPKPTAIVSNQQAPVTKPSESKNPALADATPEMLGELDLLIQDRGMKRSDVDYWLEHGVGVNPITGPYPAGWIKMLIDMLSLEGFTAAHLRQDADEMKAKRGVRTIAKPDPKKSFVMPIGSADVKGKALSELSPAKLTEIQNWSDDEMKKTLPPKKRAELFEINSQVREEIKTRGSK